VKILIVEDNSEYCEGYLLRICKSILPPGAVEFTQVRTILEAIPVVCSPEWQAIIVDFDLPAPKKDDVLPDGSPVPPIRNGAHLVHLRRRWENERKTLPIPVMGNAAHEVGNRALRAAGTSHNFSKLNTVELAKAIKGILPQ